MRPSNTESWLKKKCDLSLKFCLIMAYIYTLSSQLLRSILTGLGIQHIWGREDGLLENQR